MKDFRIVRGGYATALTDPEAEIVEVFIEQVARTLGINLELLVEVRTGLITEEDAMDLDNELLAFENELAELEGRESMVGKLPDPESSVIKRLLPPMSLDPEEAASLNELTRDWIFDVKAGNLTTLYVALKGREDADSDGERAISVTNEDAPGWAAALTDLRLYMADRLEITDDDSAAAIQARVNSFSEEHLEDPKNHQDLLGVFYTMLTWWQDSLVTAMRRKSYRG